MKFDYELWRWRARCGWRERVKPWLQFIAIAPLAFVYVVWVQLSALAQRIIKGVKR